ncbi:MAG: iron-containing alcohol dehydrogenase [Firmicutes bacterium]|nr:iron-containing alcohol dehydrogenase [Bacillota bacterium]
MTKVQKRRAGEILRQFKGDSYTFGLGVLDKVGEQAAELGKTAMVIANPADWLKPTVDQVVAALQEKGVKLAPDYIVPDAAPNAPREDVFRLETYILHFQPDVIVVIGGGSSIDAAKAANVLATLGTYDPDIERYFGTGEVTKALAATGKELKPLIAVATAASSGAHLTKYSNITDLTVGQKKLIVDDAVVPHRAVFDYRLTKSMPKGFTADGALDGVAHCLEVFYGASSETFDAIKDVALLGIELVVGNLEKVMENPNDEAGREALGLATDLGGYAIMIGGTNGAHLTSFSLVDVTSHGRACALMNPYYTVFFAPSVEKQLRLVGDIYKRAGLISEDLDKLSGRGLGIAVANGMVELSRRIGFPTKLTDLEGFTDEHIERALTAAKNPQLDMKLKNMPVPLNADLVDEYMGPILQAAKVGDFSLIKNMES